MVFDCTVGDIENDFRSFEHNFESNLFIYTPEFNEKMRHLFHADMEKCEQIRLPRWRRRPLHRKALESIVRLLSPIL